MSESNKYKIGDIIIGEFEVLDIFGGEGKSGMGVVYLVKSRDYSLPIVIKTFQKNNVDSIKRFYSEAEIWISIGIHQNIVKALFVREINNQLFVGAEYIKPDKPKERTESKDNYRNLEDEITGRPEKNSLTDLTSKQQTSKEIGKSRENKEQAESEPDEPVRKIKRFRLQFPGIWDDDDDDMIIKTIFN